MKSNIQTQIPVPLEIKEFQKPFRAIVKKRIDRHWNSIKDYERNLGITGLDKWLRGERNYSLDKIMMLLSFFKIPLSFTVDGKSYDLYKEEKK